jgi:hypothetical protein
MKESIRGLRDYLNQKIFPKNVVVLKNVLNMVSISLESVCVWIFPHQPHPYSDIPFSYNRVGAFCLCGLLTAQHHISPTKRAKSVDTEMTLSGC